MRLYKMEILRSPELTKHADGNQYMPEGYGEQYPKGLEAEWVEHCNDTWGEFRSFFLPNDRKLYRSRSSARDKQQIVEHWGGEAQVLVAEVGEFVPVDEARRRREATRKLERADRLRAEAYRLEVEAGAAVVPF